MDRHIPVYSITINFFRVGRLMWFNPAKKYTLAKTAREKGSVKNGN